MTGGWEVYFGLLDKALDKVDVKEEEGKYYVEIEYKVSEECAVKGKLQVIEEMNMKKIP